MIKRLKHSDHGVSISVLVLLILTLLSPYLLANHGTQGKVFATSNLLTTTPQVTLGAKVLADPSPPTVAQGEIQSAEYVAPPEPVAAEPTPPVATPSKLATAISRPVQVSSWTNHFPFGSCTYWPAQRRYVPWYGNAGEWLSNAAAMGYATGSRPALGAIMVSYEGDSRGHVAYVESVSGNTFTVSEMSYYANGGGWGKVDYRTITLGSIYIAGFIY